VLTLVVAPLAALVALEAFQAFGRAPALARSRELLTHTFEVIDSAQRLRSALQDAERGQRGFLITGAPAYLEAYHSGLAEAAPRLQRLRELTADNPEQRARLEHLATSMAVKLKEMQQVLDVYGQSGLAAAQQMVRDNTGLEAMRAIETDLAQTVSSERALLATRLESASLEERRTAYVAFLDTALALAMLIIGVLLTLLAFRNARRLEAERRTTEQHLGEQLMRAQAAAAQSQKMESLGQLTGGVAHDFNNLLHVINNALTLLERHLRGRDPQVTGYLEMIRRNADRAASVTARLLAFSRQQPLDPKPTDVNRLVSGMAEMLSHTLGESVSLEMVRGGSVWPVAVDRNQLETAIVNLALNARDAMPAGGRLTIETSNTYLDEGYVGNHPELKEGQYAMIAVSDSGLGMSPDVAARAFDPFFTTKEAGKGTGLGLSQVFGFIKQSGGHIKIYSELGQGTTVKLYLPRLNGTGADAADVAVLPHSPGQGESILVVEDHEDVRAFTAQILSALGYQVTAAADAAAALRLLEQLAGIDLLFTDVGLPGMGGRALADEVLRRWPGTKVLYTTGYARNSIIHHGRLDPGVALITKPFTQASLAAKIRAVLDL